MANAPAIVEIALEVLPDEVCLVPERRQELTTEGGLDVARHAKELRPTVAALAEAGVSVSLFVEPDRAQLEAAAGLGAPYVELHTGSYGNAAGDAAEREIRRLIEGARIAHGLGLKVNAGHGINLQNLDGVLRMPFLDTLNIGHYVVARAVFVGLEAAVKELLDAMSAYCGGQA